jgi:hypothetical protein
VNTDHVLDLVLDSENTAVPLISPLLHSASDGVGETASEEKTTLIMERGRVILAVKDNKVEQEAES